MPADHRTSGRPDLSGGGSHIGREPVAVVGMSVRFPGGASTPVKFWDLLANGRHGVRAIDRWNPTHGSGLPRWGATLDGIDLFDAEFFGIHAMEAVRMDPQQRLLLEVVWEALENAGQPADRLAGSRSGVFVGIYNSDYAWEQTAAGIPDDVYSGVGSGGAIAANRVSYLLDLRGPSLAIDTTCSSSLVATHLAVESLRRRESDLAIAGGVNLTMSPAVAKSVAAVIPMASDGFCKPFDSRADGIVRGEGCAALVLKRLSDARADGDPILALIAGSAVNQDGRSNGFTAPNLLAQQDVMRAALDDAQLNAAAISYVEAHGTGTALGDPIEWEALESVIGRDRQNGRCLVGSVKANIGHCEAASGIAGLVKTILALQHRRIPMQAHFESPSARLVSYGRNLVTPASTSSWNGPEPLRAGVSAFSVGGTNAHVVVEEAPRQRRELPGSAARTQPHVLPISARHPAALRQLIQAYAELLDSGVNVHDLCFTAARRRTHLPLRTAVTGESAEALRSRLIERLSAVPVEVRGRTAPESEAHRIATLYEEGHDPDWTALYPEGRVVPLPNYPWQRKRYWFTAHATSAAPGPEANPDGPQKYVYHIDWGEMGAAASSNVHRFDPRSAGRVASAALPALAEESGFTHYQWSAPELEARAGRAIEAALYRAGWRPAAAFEFQGDQLRADLGVRHEYERLFTRVLDVLAEDGTLERTGADGWRVSRPLQDFAWPDGADAAAGSEASLLRRCTASFCEALRGECNPLELLFPGGMQQAEALFSESAFAKLFNGLAAKAFASIIASAPAGAPIRVLEIGAGTGGTTAALLAECPPERTQYVYTDVSPSFFGRAREKFARYPFLSYRVLDIELDPSVQAFAGQTFDIVVAAHVLHATPHLREAVRHARALLAPGGALLLVESTARQRLTDFTYGLTPGWWKHADEDLRGGHPLLPADAWLDLLRQSRFATAVCTPDIGPDADSYGAAVIVAQAAPQAVQTVAAAGRWILIGDSGCADGFRTAIEALGGTADRVASSDQLGATLSEAECAGVIHLRGMDASCCDADTGEQVLGLALAACRDVIATAQILGACVTAAPRLWLMTRGARTSQPSLTQGPRDAIGAVVASEYPGIWGGSVDLEVDAEPDYGRVLEAMLRAAPRAEFAARADRILSPTIVRAPVRDSPGRVPFDRRGAYLITGGFGGMGLRIADWISERGGGCLVLAGRRGATPDSRGVIDTIVRRGTVLLLESVDVGEEEAVRALLARIRESGFPLRGVIHAAGTFEDQLLARHDWNAFGRVFLPKALGAWNLHRLTSNCQLDHFVLFSSAARYLNPTGLANYAAANAFLDALAQHRRSRSLPGMSIAWAGWTGTGMADALPQRRVDQWERSGVRSLEPETGLAVLERLLASGPAHALVMDLDRPLDGAGGNKESAALTRTLLAARVAGTPSAERERTVRQYVIAEAARVMDAGRAQIDAGTPLADLGFDSLMAIELRNSLATAAALDLPASFVFDYPTVDAMTRRLLALMFPEPVTPQRAAPTGHVASLLREMDGLTDDDVEAQLERYARSLLRHS